MNVGDARPPWRSLLYVPATNRRFVEKAGSRGADGVILDLEDSIAPGAKAAAREALPGAIERVASSRSEVLVRINRDDEMAESDLDAAVRTGVSALVLPKVDTVEHVSERARAVSGLERARGLGAGSIRFVALLETPGALFKAAELASAHARLAAISLGGEDFAAACGFAPSEETLAFACQLVQVAARAAGIAPLGLMGASIADFADLDAVRQAAERARRFGFDGASCIHPSVVAVLNECFSPPADEVAHARRVVDAYDAALEAGVGAIVVDGRMIDIPIANRARMLLERHRRIVAREEPGGTSGG